MKGKGRKDQICIDLSCTQMTDQTLSLVFQSKDTHKVRQLKLNFCNAGPKALFKLATFRWDNLTVLYIQHNNIQDKGCKHLTTICIPKLKQLKLGHSRIGASGMVHIMKGNWPELQYLALNDNWLVNSWLWVSKWNFKNLRQVNMGQTSFIDSEMKFFLLLDCKFLQDFQQGNFRNDISSHQSLADYMLIIAKYPEVFSSKMI